MAATAPPLGVTVLAATFPRNSLMVWLAKFMSGQEVGTVKYLFRSAIQLRIHSIPLATYSSVFS
ncbi:hypothetical protein C450_20296 [Halococcus salifodinae DSM 8989]|uniref:Uncharacterized protein n=1 Tax=Halococcus salifodinae DSM 8989 TaxID=1227456 RepID=M0MUD9_9EURY|nr:hypothetical protein C450_20296 [Halococcus salifodinae DSM 8989]